MSVHQPVKTRQDAAALSFLLRTLSDEAGPIIAGAWSWFARAQVIAVGIPGEGALVWTREAAGPHFCRGTHGGGDPIEAMKMLLPGALALDARIIVRPLRPTENGLARMALACSEPSALATGEHAQAEMLAEMLRRILETVALRLQEQTLSRGLAAAVELHRLLAGALDMEQLFSGVFEFLKEMVGVGGAGVLLYEAQTNELVLQKPAFNSEDDRLIDAYRVEVKPERQRDTTAVRVFLTGEAVINNNPQGTSSINRRFVRLYGVNSSLTVPMQVEGRIIGVLHVVNKLGGQFNTYDLQIVSLVAAQLAVLIENGRLVNRLRRQGQENRLLYEIGTAISVSLQPNQVLNEVMDKSRCLLRAESAAVVLVDAAAGVGEVCFATGTPAQALEGLHFGPGRGTVGLVLATGDPICHDLSELAARGEPEAIDLAARKVGLDAALAVPLRAGTAILGVLVAWRKGDRPFGPTETELLARLSLPVAAALDKAQRFEIERHNVVELQRLNQVIEQQNAMQKRSLDIHRALTNLVLEARGIQAITDVLADLLGGPVLVQDQFLRLVAVQDHGRPPDPEWQQLLQLGQAPWRAAGLSGNKGRPDTDMAVCLKQLAESGKPALLPAAPFFGRNHPRLMAPIVVEREVLGYITTLHRAEQARFSEIDFMVLEQAATVYALEMLYRKTALDVEYRLRGDLLFDLCCGRVGSEQIFLDRAAMYGYDLGPSRHVLLLEFDPAPPSAGDRDPAGRMRRLMDLVRTFLTERGLDCPMAVRGESLLLLPATADGCAAALARELQRRVNLFIPQTLSVGIGSECANLAAYTQSFNEARQALQVARNQNRTAAVIRFGDLGVYGLLHQAADPQSLDYFVRRTLGPLLDYDARHGTNLLVTLDAFLRCHGNRSLTCKRLFIHINTLTYRLRRIQEVAGVDLADHDCRLNLDLALRVLETLQQNG